MIRQILSRRRKGAMAMVALAALVPVSAMMSANLNTSQMVDDRRQVQDAADALATMHGTWSARALNIISMNNVTAAQLLTVAVGSEALFATNIELIGGATVATGLIGVHAASECNIRTPPPASIVESLWVGFCSAYHTALTFPAMLAAARAGDILSDFDPLHGIETATKALEAIDGMNRSLVARHPRAMAEIAEDYRQLLAIDDHHFADPCNGPGVENCRETNSDDGMALPLVEADILALTRLLFVMENGTTLSATTDGTTLSDTTFEERGFMDAGPLAEGGSSARPKVDEHINNITEIGNALYEFDRFYDSRISHMPRHPLSPPTILAPTQLPPYEDAYRGDRFVDRERNFWDTLPGILETVVGIIKPILGFARNVTPVSFDNHSGYLLQRTQGRTSNNSFFRNITSAKGMILLGESRGSIPFFAPVPQIWQLEEINPLNPQPPVEPTKMPEAFHVLSYALKEKSQRLSETVIPNSVDTHTGYGQTGIFNPDGATLFSQNWQAQMMPATRLDEISTASQNLAREARSSFDDLAEELRQVRNTSSWGRVNAH